MPTVESVYCKVCAAEGFVRPATKMVRLIIDEVLAGGDTRWTKFSDQFVCDDDANAVTTIGALWPNEVKITVVDLTK